MAGTNIQNRVKVLRLLNGGYTQAELGEKIGVTRQTVIAIEAAKYSPSLEIAFKLSKLFSTPIEEIFQYSDTGEE